jgi:hypothetical protein
MQTSSLQGTGCVWFEMSTARKKKKLNPENDQNNVVYYKKTFESSTPKILKQTSVSMPSASHEVHAHTDVDTGCLKIKYQK